MTVYILPEMRDKFEKLIARASKHLAVKPSITFHEQVTKTKQTIVNWSCDGERGTDKYKDVIDVIPVDIDEITSGDWILVADVFYKERVVGMVNAKHYGEIPAVFGLDYTKCDYCGHTHPNRTKAHIVYNTKTGEWKQIGTSCGAKMFRGGDICRFTVKLIEVFNEVFACVGDENWGAWCGRMVDHSWMTAYNINRVIAAVVGYRKEVNPNWEKAERDDRGRKLSAGTNGLLFTYFEERQTAHDVTAADGTVCHFDELVVDEDYCREVAEYVKGLPDDNQTDEWGHTEYGFNGKIKVAFEAGYIQSKDFYAVFFAVKGYEEALTLGDWAKQVARFKVGEKNDFEGVVLVSKEFYDDFYGCGWYAKFQTKDGVTVTKNFNNWDSFEDKFKNEDGTFTFRAAVEYISDKRRYVKLGGRVSAIR